MTTTTVRATSPTSATPTSTVPSSSVPTTHRRLVVLVACGGLAAIAAGGVGIVIGERLTSRPLAVAPVTGKAVDFPSDWQVYRAGERGDVATFRPQDGWTTYRAGERAGAVGSTTASDWTTYRAGERTAVAGQRPSDWTTYRAGER